MSDKPTLYLVDGSSYLFRAFHALPPLTARDGSPTGALYGVANMLRRLIREESPEYLAVVFDAKGKTFRHELYPEYKANRPPMPDDLRLQIAPLHELVEAMGIPMLIIDDVEADDVIGTLVKQSVAEGRPVVVSTSDKDLAQLVEDDVVLVDTMSDTRLDVPGVKEKFGVGPELIIDYLALTGDASDNIPGVEKVGPKTAAKWLDKYGSLDAIMQHADEFGGKIGGYLREALEQLPLSRQLTTIKTDVALDIAPTDLDLKEPDTGKLKTLLQRFDFSSWLAELEDGGEVRAEAADYETILDQDRFETWLERLRAADLIAFDCETTALDPMVAELVGVSFAVETGEAAYLPLTHDYPGAPEQLDRDAVLDALKPLLENPEVAKVGQHIKYDMNVLSRYGIEVRGVAFDTMLESYVLNSTATRHDMDSLAKKYLAVETIHFEDIAGKGAKQLTFNQIDLEEAGPYAAEDADITLGLHQVLWPQLQDDADLKRVFEDLEVPLIPVLSRMELTGVLVDADELARQSQAIGKAMLEIEEQAFDAAGQSFNLGSPKQLQEILFDKLDLRVVRKTPKGQPSTAEDVLEELAGEHDLPRLILDYRSLSKLKSTYTDKLPQQINPHTGRVHTSYHQAVAATGRLSSADPNLQNIPIRTAQGRQVRQAFVAPEGRLLLAADYSQIELRIMAHLSGDKGLLEAFRKDLDVHSATAAEVFGVPLDDVSGEQRRAAKAINFGLMYGMSAFGLSRQLNLPRGEAQDYIDVYFARYPGVRKFMDRTREQAHEDGFVQTLFGRKLFLPEINSRNRQRSQAAERAAINAPMQGTAADIIKRAMLSVDEWIQRDEPGATLIMQVHDELVLEVDQDRVEAVTDGIRQRMTSAAELDVPLIVDIGSGDNWDQAH